MSARNGKHLFRQIVLLLFIMQAPLRAASPVALEQNFSNPPDACRPWVYWFWSNGNVTKEGITADLEAMKRVGIGGVLIMDVVERFAPPEGPAIFMGPQWQSLFQFALTEAHRLGLEVNMTNGPGWCGSSGPWITPELSMQMLVKTDVDVAGPTHFDAVLQTPRRVATTRAASQPSPIMAANFYNDIAVSAFPEPSGGPIPQDQIVDLTLKMDANGRLTWDVPAGKWRIERIGHTSTGSSTRPPVLGGNGLECDKLSAQAMDAHFAGMMQKLIEQAGSLAGSTLVATHIDSWEVGKQNWTRTFREEFQKRRGYDCTPFLPALLAKVDIGSLEKSARFRWDFSQTISELLAENYTGRIAALAHQHGMRFTLEGYNLPFGDEETYTAAADEPMTEFWTLGSARGETERKAHQMASVAHLYGRPVVGAESFTSGDKEAWKLTPAMIKSEGDFEFCQGVNRFVFHRYAHQPYLDRVPGATMGPWGLHYERTNTWWEMSRPWHEYLARCQYLLRQGLFVADLLYVRPELPNQTYFAPMPPPPDGYQYDQASAQAIIERASVKNGRIILPDGMSYRILLLPPKQRTMTPVFLQKLKDLVSAGAVLYGPPPQASPSLTDYPHCDRVIADLAKELWGNCDGNTVTVHAYGKGRVIWGQPLQDTLTTLQAGPDFINDCKLNWIHRHVEGAEIYFIANPAPEAVTAHCAFRAAGLRPELWNPETGAFSSLKTTESSATGVTLPITLDPSGSAFIVFRPAEVVSQTLVEPLGLTQSLGEIAGPWGLKFPPKRGAPDSATLPSLISWSESPIEGIKYFSGTARYSKTFSADGSWVSKGQRTAIDLGDVEVMADVTLNGKDLGVLWKSPYRVETTGLLKAGMNELQIDVVNLWPNRMIGDAALPEDKRITWSSWEPFKKETPLMKSGLIGPVTMQGANAPATQK